MTVVEALIHAGEALQEEIDHPRQSESAEGSTEVGSVQPAEDPDEYDPDAFAAAFMARQEAAKRYERTLPVQEWAAVIAKHCKLEGNNRVEQSAKSVRHDASQSQVDELNDTPETAEDGQRK